MHELTNFNLLEKSIASLSLLSLPTFNPIHHQPG